MAIYVIRAARNRKYASLAPFSPSPGLQACLVPLTHFSRSRFFCFLSRFLAFFLALPPSLSSVVLLISPDNNNSGQETRREGAAGRRKGPVQRCDNRVRGRQSEYVRLEVRVENSADHDVQPIWLGRSKGLQPRRTRAGRLWLTLSSPTSIPLYVIGVCSCFGKSTGLVGSSKNEVQDKGVPPKHKQPDWRYEHTLPLSSLKPIPAQPSVSTSCPRSGAPRFPSRLPCCRCRPSCAPQSRTIHR